MQINTRVTIAAVLAIIIMVLLSNIQSLSLDPSLTGAVILKDRCDTTPETMVLFGSNDNKVYGLDAKTGCVVWRFDEATADIKTPAHVQQGLVFVGSTDQMLYALSVQDGTLQWSATLSGDLFGGVASNSKHVFVADTNGDIAAYGLSSGTADWTYETHFSKQDVVYDESYDHMEIMSATVYAVEEYLHKGHIVALKADTGQLKWKFSAESMIYTAPAVGEAVYVPTSGNKLYRVHKEYGVAQSYFATTAAIRSTPFVEFMENGKEMIYFGSDDGKFYAVEAASDGTMKEKWSYFIGPYKIVAPVAASEALVYFMAEDKKVYALNKETGILIWSYTMGKKHYTGPVVSEGIVYVAAGDHSVYTFDEVTGDPLWSYQTRGILYGEVAVAPYEELQVSIEEGAGTDDKFIGDPDSLKEEAWGLKDDLKSILEEVDELETSLSAVGNDPEIDSDIDDLRDLVEASIETLDTNVDALLTSILTMETDEEYDTVVASLATLSTDTASTVASYEVLIAGIENDILCLKNPHDSKCA
jgi:eukaryotic-like serine/threonine-protein kinase